MRPALILQHGPTGPAGLLGEWAHARGIAVEALHTDRERSLPELEGRAFLACLGSRNNPNELEVPAVVQTLELVRSAVEQDVPVLGLCYGGQALAAVTGGRVEPAPDPQHGWFEIETDDPELVPAGPWLEWHYERFTLPPGAIELARTGDTVQAFTLGPHLGVQFHPESTIEIVTNWARADQPRLTALGLGDGVELLESGRSHAQAARGAADQLFDAFWKRASERPRTTGRIERRRP
ncbi:MAG: type 1 glutamine amidotransferase [Solirubrobacteraceae bacterium]